MRRSISIILAGAVAATSAAASFVPAQAAMPTIAPDVASQSADIIQVERDNIDGKWFYYPGSPSWRSRNGGGWNGHHGGGWDNNNGWHPGGNGWDNNWNHGGWDDDDWGWRHRRHRDNDGAGLALGLFGFAAGALVGSQLQGGGGGFDSHDAACARRFRSYDPYSNTYMGYDGDRHYC